MIISTLDGIRITQLDCLGDGSIVGCLQEARIWCLGEVQDSLSHLMDEADTKTDSDADADAETE